MKRRTQWSVALLIGGLSIAGLITASVAVSQEATPPAIDPTAILDRPGAPGAPQALPAPGGGTEPITSTPPVAGASGLPPASVTIPGPAATIRPEPGPGAPPGAGNATGAPTPGAGGFPGMSPPADNSNIQVIGLRHANPQSVREVIETLMPAARGLVVVDTRTNLLIARVPQQTFQEIQQLVQVLDAPNPKGTGFGGSMTVFDKPKGRPGGAGGADYVGFTTTSAAELRHIYEQHDHATRELAEAIKRGSGGPALREQLKARVSQAFVARQQLLRFELADLQRRMKESQESIDLRDRVANQIIDRRVSELLDPSLQWEPATGLASGTGAGMRGPGSVPSNRPRTEDLSQGGPRGEAPTFDANSPQGGGPAPLSRTVPTSPAPRRPGSGTAADRSELLFEEDPFEAPNPASAPLNGPPAVELTPTPQPRATPPENVGTLRGRVIFDGPFTTLAPLYKKGAAPKDTSICGAEEIPDERILVNHSNGLANVFIYLEKAPAGTTPPPVTGPLILDQSGCIFQPRALVVRTEQVIRVFNSDPIAHNVHNYPIKSAVTNMVIAPNDNTGIALKYGVPEKEPVAVGCDIHPWMQAYHLPLNHSFAAVTDADGAFEIADLPAGTHKFKVWHEAGKMLERALEVAIKPGDNDVKIRVSAGQFPKQPPAPGGLPTQKPNGTKAAPFIPDANPLRKEVPADQFKNNI